MEATRHQTARQTVLERFERATELPLLILALAMIPLILVPLVVELDGTADAVVMAADWFIWAAFAFEYIVRLALTDQRARFVRREWPDLLIVVLPFLRPLRIMRSARALRLLRLARLAAVLTVATQEGRRLLTPQAPLRAAHHDGDDRRMCPARTLG
jgi:voltage-gated potassium channel